MLVGGIEVSEEDAERLKQLVRGRAKATAYELKQKAWDLATEGFKTDFNIEWCSKFIKAFPEDMEYEQAVLLSDLMDLYVAFKSKNITFQEGESETEAKIQKFITAVYMQEVG